MKWYGFNMLWTFSSDGKEGSKNPESIRIDENDVDIVVLTIPKSEARRSAQMLADTKVKAIWNFAHVDLELPPHIQVENVHLQDSLMKLSYNISKSGNS